MQLVKQSQRQVEDGRIVGEPVAGQGAALTTYIHSCMYVVRGKTSVVSTLDGLNFQPVWVFLYVGSLIPFHLPTPLGGCGVGAQGWGDGSGKRANIW